MGGVCDCLTPEQTPPSQPTPRTPLLAEINANQPQSSKSVRLHTAERTEFLTSVEELAPISCGKIPLPAIDKTFHDHSKLFNDLLENFNSLRQTLLDLKRAVNANCEAGENVQSYTECFTKILQTCGEAELTLKRTKYCIKIEYNAREVSECATMLAEDAIECLELYNKANNFCKFILEKSSRIQSSVKVVLEDEKRLRMEIMKANLDNTEAPEVMKTCMANINKLRRMPGAVDTIHKHTEKTFNLIREASRVFVRES